MAGRIITNASHVVVRHPSGGPSGATLLSDEAGYSCCCTEPACCVSCYNAVDQGNGSRCSSKACCFTTENGSPTGADAPVDGYWYLRRDFGANFQIVEVTQTGAAGWNQAGGFWTFTVDIRQRCRTGGNILDFTTSDVATLYPGFEYRFETNQCYHLFGPSGTYSGGLSQCCFFEPQGGSCDWTIFQPFRQDQFSNWTDPEPESLDCYQDNRNGSFVNPFDGGTYTYSLYYNVAKCAERCTTGCTTCP